MTTALLMLAFFGAIGLAYFVLSKRRLNSLFLTDELHGSANGSPEKALKVGQVGRASTRLGPMGRAEFDGNEVEVTSRDGMINAGAAIQIVRLEQGRVTVKIIENQ